MYEVENPQVLGIIKPDEIYHASVVAPEPRYLHAMLNIANLMEPISWDDFTYMLERGGRTL